MRLRGTTVVITGAAGGIGRALVLAFAREGADLVCVDLDQSAAGVAAEARRAGVRAVAQPGDVTRAADMAEVARRAVDELGRLDVLVTCAGIDGSGLLIEQDEAVWTRVIDVNLCGTYRAIRACLPPMLEPDEVAHAATFLALRESGGITGQALNVDGGFFMS